jgi:biopolymer transport protein ExbB
MRSLAELFVSSQDFLEMGGDVLLVILATTFVMWALIIERYWYFRQAAPETVAEVTERWRRRRERTSWHAHQIRRATVSRLSIEMHHSIPFIKTLVAVCPMLGLLGTVTGMVEVFDVMAFSGSGNPRAMAGGVSRATIPTMAGMVAAISGFLFSVALERRARQATQRIADELAPE